MTFPPAGAVIIRNDEGEPLGWDVPSEPDPGDIADEFYEDERIFDDEDMLEDWEDV